MDSKGGRTEERERNRPVYVQRGMPSTEIQMIDWRKIGTLSLDSNLQSANREHGQGGVNGKQIERR